MNDKLQHSTKQLNKPGDTPTAQLLIIRPGFCAIVLTPAALEAIENGLIEADTWTSQKESFFDQAFSETTTILKN